jgi:hypothetical protein
MSTVTAGDYTVDLPISEVMLAAFKKDQPNASAYVLK